MNKTLEQIVTTRARMNELFLEDFEIVRIELQKNAAEQLNKDLAKEMGSKVPIQLQELFQIPVIVDDSIPSEVCFLMRKRPPNEPKEKTKVDDGQQTKGTN